MAISASRLPFRSLRHYPSSSVKEDELSSPKAEENPSSRQGTGNTDGTKKASRRDKIKFFQRLSIRISKPDSATPPSQLVKQRSPLSNHITSQSHKTGQSDLSGNLTSHPRSSGSNSQPIFRESADMSTCCSSYQSDSLEHLKDIVDATSDSTTKPRSSRASLFFWKRTSQSLDSVIPRTEIINHLPESGSIDDNISSNVSCDGASSGLMPCEVSESISSGHETIATSVDSTASQENDNNDCGLAGIGIRDRNSISQYSIPVRHSLSPVSSPVVNTNKPPFHPAMRYAPSNSSPLSSRSHSPSDIAASNMTTPSSNTSSASYKHQSGVPSIHRQSFLQNYSRQSSGRLNLVPNQSSITSEELMKFLRGPSSYPEETLPRSNDRSSLYLCV